MIDKSIAIQIIGSLMKRPSFLSQSDRYHLEPEDFDKRLHRIIFRAIDNLYKQGASKITPFDVDVYFQSFPSAKVLFDQENGIEFLQDCEYLAEEGNFDVYYKRLKKFGLIEQLKKDGFDTSEFYNENLADPSSIETNEKFERLEISDIIDEYKKKILKAEHDYSPDESTETRSAFEGMENVLEDAKEGNDIGLPLQGSVYNEIVGGARLGTFYLRSCGSGVGKALPNSTKIPTPIGWRRVDEIKAGDYLFDAFGKPTKVLGVYPQGTKEVWEVAFEDGRSAKCCEEHLWSYNTSEQHSDSIERRKFFTKTLKEIRNTEQLRTKDGKNYRILVPMQKAVEYSEREHSIPPYIFGVLLGEGRPFQHGKTLPFFPSEDVLKEYPELINAGDKGKFIPRDYIEDSVENRYELLRGLLDVNGGRASFSTISERLRDGVVEIAQSLGLKVHVTTDANAAYCIDIGGSSEDIETISKLAREREKKEERNTHVPVVDIRELGYSEEMTCFYVDNPEHLFLTENFIVTHNTRQAVGDACYLAFPIRYDPVRCEWVQTGSCQKVLYIATEQDFKEIQRMILAYLTGMEESRLRYGNFSKDEEKVLRQALFILERYKDNLYLVRMPNPSIALTKTLIRENCLTKNIRYVFYDYIFVGPALLNEFKGFGLRNDELLLLHATALKDLAVELGVFVASSTQLNAKGDDNENIRNEASLAGGRATINKADVGVVCARPTKDELEILGKELGLVQLPNLVTDVYKVRSGRYTQCRIWSYIDLGTLRKEDLFVTDARLQPLADFSFELPRIVDWTDEEYNEIQTYIKELND